MRLRCLAQSPSGSRPIGFHQIVGEAFRLAELGPLEAYARQIDDLVERHPQRNSFRRYLGGVPLPVEQNKTVTVLMNPEPVSGTQHAAVHRRAGA